MLAPIVLSRLARSIKLSDGSHASDALNSLVERTAAYYESPHGLFIVGSVGL
jgi:hypothetical protein